MRTAYEVDESVQLDTLVLLHVILKRARCSVAFAAVAESSSMFRSFIAKLDVAESLHRYLVRLIDEQQRYSRKRPILVVSHD